MDRYAPQPYTRAYKQRNRNRNQMTTQEKTTIKYIGEDHKNLNFESHFSEGYNVTRNATTFTHVYSMHTLMKGQLFTHVTENVYARGSDGRHVRIDDDMLEKFEEI